MNRRVTRETEILKQARHRLGYSQQQVATIAGLQIRQYQRFEYGETEIHRINIRAGLLLCAALELDPVELVFGEKSEELAILGIRRPLKGNPKKRKEN